MAFNLDATIRLRDKYSKPMSKVTGVTKKLDKAFGKLVKGGAVAAAAGIAAVGTAAIKAGMQQEDAFKRIRVGTGATGDDLEGLMDVYENIGRQVPDDLGSVAQATADLNTLTGATGDDLETMTKSVLDASRSMGEDGVANANSFGKALQQWSIDASEAETTSAQLFKIAQNTGVGFGELSGQLSTYGSVMQNAGFSAIETADMFGKLQKSGIDVSRVMPGLNMAFRNWAGEGKNVQDELASTITQMQEAESSSEALSIATERFGAEGAQRLTTAIRNGTISLDDLGAGLEGAVGDMQAASEESLTFGERFSMIGNNASLALAPLGEVLLGIAEEYMPLLQDKLQQLATWVEENMPMIREKFEEFGTKARDAIETVVEKATEFYNFVEDNWTTIKVTVTGVITSLIALRLAVAALQVIQTITALWKGYKAIMVAVKTSQLATNAAMWANPIGVVIGLIVGLIAVGVLLYKNFDTVKKYIGMLWDGMKSAWNAMWGLTKDIFGKIGRWIKSTWEGVRDATDTVWYNIEKAIVNSINAVVDSINWMIDKINAIPGVNVPIVPQVSAPDVPDSIAVQSRQMRGGARSHYHGLDSVPYDGYKASLHKGETVLNRQEADEYRNGHTGSGVNVNIASMTVREEADIDKVTDALVRKIQWAGGGGA